ncbi:MAG: hypothetical protein RLZZ292_3812, partial [Bacteroidota bacterium]
SKFLAAIVVVTALYSIMLRIMNGGNMAIHNKPILFDKVKPLNECLPQIEIGTFALLTLFTTILAIGLYFLLKSKWGLHLRATCANPTYAKGLGLSLPLYLPLGLAVGNALAGISGYLFAMKSGFADVGLSQGILITGLAALSIGERLVPTKKLSLLSFTILTAIIGSVIYQIIWAMALQFNLKPTDLKLVSALILVTLYSFNTQKEKLDIEYE